MLVVTTTFQNGKKNGPQESWRYSQKRQEGQYRNDRKVGVWRVYSGRYLRMEGVCFYRGIDDYQCRVMYAFDGTVDTIACNRNADEITLDEFCQLAEGQIEKKEIDRLRKLGK